MKGLHEGLPTPNISILLKTPTPERNRSSLTLIPKVVSAWLFTVSNHSLKASCNTTLFLHGLMCHDTLLCGNVRQCHWCRINYLYHDNEISTKPFAFSPLQNIKQILELIQWSSIYVFLCVLIVLIQSSIVLNWIGGLLAQRDGPCYDFYAADMKINIH